MPMKVKGNAARKPPRFTTDHTVVDACIERQMPQLQPILRVVDEAIESTIPGCVYADRRRRPLYGLPAAGWIIEVAAYDVSVNILFHGGADFPSPPPMGEVDRTRYVKVTTVSEALAPEVLEWIAEAGRTPGWGPIEPAS